MLVGITLGKRWFWTQAADDSVSTVVDDSVSTVSHPFYYDYKGIIK